MNWLSFNDDIVTYNVPNLPICIPIYSLFNIIYYSFTIYEAPSCVVQLRSTRCSRRNYTSVKQVRARVKSDCPCSSKLVENFFVSTPWYKHLNAWRNRWKNAKKYSSTHKLDHFIIFQFKEDRNQIKVEAKPIITIICLFPKEMLTSTKTQNPSNQD